MDVDHIKIIKEEDDQQQRKDLKMIEERLATDLGTKRTFSSTHWFQNLKKLRSAQKVLDQARKPLQSSKRTLQNEVQGLKFFRYKLIVQLGKALLRCGVPPAEIAIITSSKFEKNHLLTKLNVSSTKTELILNICHCRAA